MKAVQASLLIMGLKNSTAMNMIFASRHIFEISKAIVRRDSILVVDLHSIRAFPDKGSRYQAVNEEPLSPSEHDPAIAQNGSIAKVNSAAIDSHYTSLIRNFVKGFVADYISPLFHRAAILTLKAVEN